MAAIRKRVRRTPTALAAAYAAISVAAPDALGSTLVAASNVDALNFETPTVVIPGTMPVNQTRLLTESNQTLVYEPYQTSSPGACSSRFVVPEAPERATDLNGIGLPPVCFLEPGLHHIFVIGDWGGIASRDGAVPRPADHRSLHFPAHHRRFVVGADDVAQQNVARQMKSKARSSRPDYVVNVGDNFYWGGIQVKCGAPVSRSSDVTGQWYHIFERMYNGDGLDGKQWLGVLGNHDFGGYVFTNGWDQVIAYTWAEGSASTGRWMTPALYWSQKVHYSDFSIDYFFVDSNVFDAFEPHADQHHNLCSKDHNPALASCGLQGPVDIYECPKWFKRLWNAQLHWLEKGLHDSASDWQIIVTHFPPEHGERVWKRIARTYGVDLLISGHRHQQEVHGSTDESNFLRPTAYIVSGGGGGITSEMVPKIDGEDDQYGFMDLTLSKLEIMVEAISHGGQTRSTTCLAQRAPMADHAIPVTPSLCDGRPRVSDRMTVASVIEGSGYRQEPDESDDRGAGRSPSATWQQISQSERYV